MPEPLVHEVTLRCSVAHAYHVFTRRTDMWWPKGHRRFEDSHLAQDAHVGGQLLERAVTGEVFVLADVIACDPPHRIEFAWHPGKISQPTRTVITFTEMGDHVVHVQVVHSEADADLGEHWAQRAALFASGWTAVLRALAAHIRDEES